MSGCCCRESKESRCCRGCCKNCYCAPQFIGPAVACFVAMVLTFTFSMGCQFYHTYENSTTGLYVPEPNRNHGQSVGIWTVGIYRNSSSWYNRYRDDDDEDFDDYYDHYWCDCTYYDVKDAATQAARAFSAIAMVLAIPLFVCTMILSFVPYKKPFVQAVRVACFVQGMLCLLSLVVIASGICKSAMSCAFSRNGYVSIVAMILWLATGWLLGAIPPTLRRNGEGGDSTISTRSVSLVSSSPVSEHVTIEKTTHEDGAVSIVTTTRTPNKDGSFTVTTEQTTVDAPSVVEAEPVLDTNAAVTHVPYPYDHKLVVLDETV